MNTVVLRPRKRGRLRPYARCPMLVPETAPPSGSAVLCPLNYPVKHFHLPLYRPTRGLLWTRSLKYSFTMRMAFGQAPAVYGAAGPEDGNPPMPPATRLSRAREG